MAVTLANWITYAAARGLIVANVAASQEALQRAQDFILYRYVANLRAPYDETLAVIEPATYEAARLELATPMIFSSTFTPAAQKVLTELEGMKWTVVGKADTPYANAPTTPLIDAMFLPYLITRPLNGAAILSVG